MVWTSQLVFDIFDWRISLVSKPEGWTCLMVKLCNTFQTYNLTSYSSSMPKNDSFTVVMLKRKACTCHIMLFRIFYDLLGKSDIWRKWKAGTTKQPELLTCLKSFFGCCTVLKGVVHPHFLCVCVKKCCLLTLMFFQIYSSFILDQNRTKIYFFYILFL